MIVVNVYENGFLIDGHALPHICEQVSLLGWNLGNTIIFNKLSYESYYSDLDVVKNKNNGISFIKFEETEFSEKLIFAFYENAKEWFNHYYPNWVKVIKHDLKVETNDKYFTPSKEYYSKCFTED